MICPKCKELGLKSVVYVGMTQYVSTYNQPFYDEEGNYHQHPVKGTGYNNCSQGHRIDFETDNRCGFCDWGSEGTSVASDNVLVTGGYTGNVTVKG